MFEKLASRCCNLLPEKVCIGVFYNVYTGEQWMELKFAHQPCRVIQGLDCWHFAEKVLPGIPKEQMTDHTKKMIKDWNDLAYSNEPAFKYNRICRKCRKIFHTNTKNQIYCQRCRKINTVINSRIATRTHKKRNRDKGDNC